tara:strand:- start:564 stop:794 length:231 start_codon:yes stop_codon:yes gene_type:complete
MTVVLKSNLNITDKLKNFFKLESSPGNVNIVIRDDFKKELISSLKELNFGTLKYGTEVMYMRGIHRVTILTVQEYI